jgi:hypothetical protein
MKLEGVIEKSAFFEKVYTDISEIKEFDPDILLFALKTYQTEDALKDAVKLKMIRFVLLLHRTVSIVSSLLRYSGIYDS